ncbi:hypothetical protein UlMin_036927 [Ulmus minor]
MSFNQSRSDKSENQYRKPGRSVSSNQQRGSSGGYGKGSGGPAPSPSLSSNRSFNKSHNNAQGGQHRGNLPTVNPSDSSNAPTQRGVQNGAHIPPQLHGGSDPPAKQTEASATQRSSRAVPKAPTSQHASLSSDTTATSTPTKAPGDGSKAFPLQFGSISPGFMNGMQVPARTSSAPPNLDEQKRDQARHDSFRPVPPVPTPSVPKQQLPRKDPVALDQPNTPEPHPLPKAKKDVQVSPLPPATQTQKPSGLPMAGISMQMPFHQSQVPMPFGGPNQPMQSQGVTANALQMQVPIQLPIGSAPQVQQPMFVSSLHSHPMQHQGIMHQGQNMGYTAQMAQLPPQLGNIGISINQQFQQQQGGKFGAPPRRTIVKITNPKTHQEVTFDKRTDGYSDGRSSAPRSHPIVPPQPQPQPQPQSISSFPASHSMNYYPGSYNANSLFYSTSSHPLTSGQMPPNSQAARFNYGPGTQNVTIMNPSALPVSKSVTHVHSVMEPPTMEHAHDGKSLMSFSPYGTTAVTVKSAAGSVGEKVDSVPNISAIVTKSEYPKPSAPSVDVSLYHTPRDETYADRSLQQSKSGSTTVVSESSLSTRDEICTDGSSQLAKSGSTTVVPESLLATNPSAGTTTSVSVEGQVSTFVPSSSVAPAEESLPVTTNTESRRREQLSRPNSMKDQQRKPGKKGCSQSQHQAGGQSTYESGVLDKVEAGTSLINEDVPVATEDSLSTISATTADVSLAKADIVVEGEEQVKHDSVGTEEQAEKVSSEGYKLDINSSEVSSEFVSLESGEHSKPMSQEFVSEESAKIVIPLEETAQGGMAESGSCSTELDRTGDSLGRSTSTLLDSKDVGSLCNDKSSSTDASLSRSDSMSNNEIASSKSGRVDQKSAPPQTTETPKHEGGSIENLCAGASVPAGFKDKPLPELTRSKSTTKGKKKRKELLQKADAAGTTSDLYMAYKGPEEKKETTMSPEVPESTIMSKQMLLDVSIEEAAVSETDAGAKAEPDDWEDAADISKPKLETLDSGEQAQGNENMVKRYSRDFLLKFSEQFTDLPENFKLTAEIAEVCSVSTSPLVDRSPFPSPGRVIDKPSPRLDRRNSGMIEDDRWNKLPSPFGPGRELRLDVGFGNTAGFRPGQGGNFGVLRNPRAPVQYSGGILSGPMHSIGSQGMQRNNPDDDRWQRASNSQKGLFPSPQTPLQMMHRAERKYEVGKVTDEEQAKQRQLKAVLNKLTPQNFEKLFQQVKDVNIDNALTLSGVISQIFDKALMEPTFCEMYANFCFHLAGDLPDFSENNEKITFKRLLLNKCQEEFERGEREQEEANKADEGEVKQSEEEREEKRVKARRRMLGNIRLIGELYKKKMLTEKIMHECIKKLLGQQQTPDEEDIEALCKLMSTIGEMIDHPKAKGHMDAYFDRMDNLSTNKSLSSRVRFMLRDAIDLRKNKWQQRRKVEGPKKIDEVHRDAAQERQAQTSRLGRGPGINPPGRRGPPMEYGQRGSMLSSPSSQMGSFRALPSQARGFGSQDVRSEERHPFEARTLSVPLTRRPDNAITLGPQGGLARGMSGRGPPSMPSAGLNGYSSVSEQASYNPREDLAQRFMPERFAGQAAYDQSSAHERNTNYAGRDLRNSDRGFDRSLQTSQPAHGQAPALTQNDSSDKAWTDERLRDMSMLAIKEYYSALEEKEIALCIKDLNSPSFHPTMISLWVIDSFEAKDKQREHLGKLLVNLTRSHDGILNQTQLLKGFESVLANLEDTVTDAPKAPQFLAGIFAKVITENVVSMGEIGQIVREGGEEPGSLVQTGLAADILGNILESIKSDKGETVLNEIVKSSKLRLETFRPAVPPPGKPSILEKFI